MKNTLITCATSQIGQAIAEKMAPDSKLILTGRNVENLNHILSSSTMPIARCQLDFFDEGSIAACAEQISACNPVDNLVLIIPRIPASSAIFLDTEQWRELYDNYFIKPLSLIKALYENNRIATGANLLIISGLSSKSALSHYASNNCLRSAWLGQAKTMALAMGEQGISVNTLSLGGVMSDSYIAKMEQKAKQQEIGYDALMQQEVSNIPLNKYASLEDVASTVHSMLGPMANHMTGQNILLDGGFFRGY
ncbi:SDR family oxidoreductase [Vibrio profundum]|uniref:SDR family oxidoreductase n=1 Tax=Vibrio profundum TaxID=2910247 RepID=UPI003D0C9036